MHFITPKTHLSAWFPIIDIRIVNLEGDHLVVEICTCMSVENNKLVVIVVINNYFVIYTRQRDVQDKEYYSKL